ncbi:hypothetical protein FisN_7Hu406 [Fistulifera solaris]|uniref:Uncharacterized protein n=1 Tax=Fistulifera solaris TaxID=1519565 RepID=A0A1Z5KRQ5_FISSO|nr:hypothetical protein FisN_7Hu406 [Fistulifera solaris]|eukprot:GAX29003.1 hypothetical protein FisN_7Hu406 [Fistulifera solaris]
MNVTDSWITHASFLSRGHLVFPQDNAVTQTVDETKTQNVDADGRSLDPDPDKKEENKSDDKEESKEEHVEVKVEDTGQSVKEEKPKGLTPFQHIMFNVFELYEDDPLHKALVHNGMATCVHLKFDNDPQYFASISYREMGNTITPIPGAIISFTRFYRFIKSLLPREFCDETAFFGLTCDMWEEFRYKIHGEWNAPVEPTPEGYRTPPRMELPIKTALAPTKAQIFQKTKRNETAFMVLKHQNQWLDWYDSTRRHANNQDCSAVLDPDYVPDTDEDEELFKYQKRYMLAVFDTILKTEKSRQILNAHNDDQDAQAVFREVVEYYTNSANSELTAQDLLSKLMQARMLTDGKGIRYETDLLKFHEKLRYYDLLVPPSERLSDALKKSLVINLIKGIPCLMNVRSGANIMGVGTGSSLTFDKYMEGLNLAALDHDDLYRGTGSSKANKLMVYNHVLFGDVECDGGGLSSQDDLYEAYMASGQSGYFPKLTREQWSKLTPEDQNVWDQLPDAGNKKYPGTLRKVNFNDTDLSSVSLGDVLNAYVHGRGDSYEEDEEEESPPIEVNQANTGTGHGKNEKYPTHPASFHQTLEKKTLPKSGENSTAKRGVHFSRLEANAAHTYSVSNHLLGDSKKSLIDRGANGGVAGEDMRLIRTVPDRFVDIQGIDNHQLPKVLIATVCGVVKTQVGEQIAIFNQYAYTGRGVSIHSSGQLEHYGHKVDDRSVKVGGTQRILRHGGYIMPLVMVRGLCRLEIRPFSDKEWRDLPHIFMTNDEEWDPSVLDHKMEENEWIGPPPPALEDTSNQNIFDEFGEYREYIDAYITDGVIANAIARVVANVIMSVPPFDPGEDHDCMDPVQDIVDKLTVADLETNPSVPTEAAVQSIDPPTGTSQLTLPEKETIDTDDPPLIADDSPKHVVTSQPDVKRKPVDMERVRPMLAYLGFDIIKETFARTTQFAREYNSPVLQKMFKSPHPALNVARRKEAIATDTIYSNTKALGSGVKHAQLFVGVDSYVIDIYPLKNQTQFASVLSDVIRERGAPTRLLSDQAKAKIADCVYYRVEHHSFPSDSREAMGYFVGVSKNVGQAMTFKILTMGTRRIIHRSAVHSALMTDNPNRRIELPGETNADRLTDTVDGEMAPPPARNLVLNSRLEE